MRATADGKNAKVTPFMAGFLDESTNTFCDHPVDVMQLPDGSMLIDYLREGHTPVPGREGRASDMRSSRYRNIHTELAMHTCRQRLLWRIPQHPTIAGYFWIAYFVALGLLIFS